MPHIDPFLELSGLAIDWSIITFPISGRFHTKMELMSMRAFGFRNFENYRLRVLAHCGWNGVFCRV
jgi:hypothetical protein